MVNEVRIEARPWEPQDLIDDLQLMIDEEPDNYLNSNRTTLCMARDYLKKFFAEETLRPKGRWEECDWVEYDGHDECVHYPHEGMVCTNCRNAFKKAFVNNPRVNFCPHCGADMRKG